MLYEALGCSPGAAFAQEGGVPLVSVQGTWEGMSDGKDTAWRRNCFSALSQPSDAEEDWESV